MRYLICYDISENPVRTRLAKYLESIAWRVQYSVFTFEGSEAKMHIVRNRLRALVESAESPHILVIPLCAACAGKTWRIGELQEPERAAFVL